MLLPENTVKELIKGLSSEQIIGQGGLLKQLQKQLIEAALKGEMTDHLGYEKHAKSEGSNARNGSFQKTLKGDFGELTIQVPRDRHGDFEPGIIKKGQTRFDGFDEKIISLYARGMTTREIQEHLYEIYGTEVSPALISTVTEEVLECAKAWQSRPLEAIYPVIYMDALWLKIRHEKRIINKAVHLCLAINLDGEKEVLGIWIHQTEGAGFWHQVLSDLNNRGVTDIYVACVDGLTGFPEAIQAIFPKTEVQTCIVHMIRNSLRYVNYKERRDIAADLKTIYGATTLDDAETCLKAFEQKWTAYPQIAASWYRHWPEITTFLAYPAGLRKILYTTNPLESVNAAIRKVTRNRLIFPHDQAAFKLIYLALEKAAKKWKAPIANWKEALASFTILYNDRLPKKLTQSA